MKSALSVVSLNLPEHYKYFFLISVWCTIPPFLPHPPLFTSLPISFSFCFRSGSVFAEGVSPESLGHSSWDVSQLLLATVWGHNDPRGTRPLVRNTQSLKYIWQDTRRDAYKECDSRKEVQKKSQTDTDSECTAWTAHNPKALLF